MATIDASGLASANNAGATGITAMNGVSSNTATLTVTVPMTAVTGAMTFARYSHHGVTLNDGTALVAGGLSPGFVDVVRAETYDPVTAVWTLTDNMVYPRHNFAMAKLGDGTVLAVGGAPSGFISNVVERSSQPLRPPT